MTPDVDTCEWLGIPTPLQTCIQHTRLLENEIKDLNRQLRVARENIFKLVEMQAQTARERDEARDYLKSKGATLAETRGELRATKVSCSVQAWEIDELRDQVARLRSVDPRSRKQLS